MGKSKKYILAGVFAATFCLASGANAEGIYAGISLGNASPEDSAFDSAVGWKLFGGYEVNNNLAIEGGYTSFGEMDGPTIFGFSTSVEPTGFELAAIGSYPINDQFSFFGKLGFLAWDFKVNIDGLGSDSTTGTDIFFGLGGKYNLSNNLDLRATWERYTVEGDNIDLLSASVVYSF
ncbi:MAG: outer membrane beta-barrel protein [Gammaproteobacteria bacterium]|nr:outer membrane beta-barrel protein [Gammaproteobacteria bacterium]